MILLHKQQPDKAIEDCDKAIELDSASLWALVIRASALISKSQPQHARRDLDRRLRFNPTNPFGRVEGSLIAAGKPASARGLKVVSTSMRIGPGERGTQDRPDASRPGVPGQVKAPDDDSDPSLAIPRTWGISWPAAGPGMPKKNTTRPWPPTTKPSGLIPTTLLPTPRVPRPGAGALPRPRGG